MYGQHGPAFGWAVIRLEILEILEKKHLLLSSLRLLIKFTPLQL